MKYIGLVMTKIYCCECNKEVNSKLIKGDKVYPHRKDLYHLNFYECPECKNFVGCHGSSRRPLGVIANKNIKDYRKRIHALIDPIWKSGKVKRSVLYTVLTIQLGRRYHTAELKNESECKWAIDQAIKLRNMADSFGSNMPKMLGKFGWYINSKEPQK